MMRICERGLLLLLLLLLMLLLLMVMMIVMVTVMVTVMMVMMRVCETRPSGIFLGCCGKSGLVLKAGSCPAMP